MAKIALVCSGGGAAASYEVGFINEFEKAGILDLVSIVAGASAGAINAAVVASGEQNKLIPIWTSLEKKNIYRESKFGAGFAYIMSAPALYSADPLRALLARSINFDAIRQRRTGRELRIVTCDLVSGEKVIFNNDTASVDSLLATTAIPGLFHPVPYHGMLLVDGGTQSNTPIGAAIKAGAEVVICLMTEPSEPEMLHRDKLKTFIDRMVRAADLSIRKNVQNDLRIARLMNKEPGRRHVEIFAPRPLKKLPIGILDFDPQKTRLVIAQGGEDARAFLSKNPNFKKFLMDYPQDSSKSATTRRSRSYSTVGLSEYLRKKIRGYIKSLQ